MSLELIVSAIEARGLKARRSADGWQAQCPAHDDARPSLSLARPLGIWCHAGCKADDILSSLGLAWSEVLGDAQSTGSSKRSGMAGSVSRMLAGKRERGKCVMPVPDDAPAVPERLLLMDGESTSRRWYFRDEAGRLLWGVLRWETKEGKTVRPLSLWNRDGALGWRLAAPPDNRPLYGLDRLAQAVDGVLLCEGEKAADAAQDLMGDRWACLGWHGGAQAISKQDWSPLSRVVESGKAEVYLWPDADTPGFVAMEKIARDLGGRFGRGAVLCEPLEHATLPKGWDLADEMPDGWGRDTVEKIMAEGWRPVCWRPGLMQEKGWLVRPQKTNRKGDRP